MSYTSVKTCVSLPGLWTKPHRLGSFNAGTSCLPEPTQGWSCCSCDGRSRPVLQTVVFFPRCLSLCPNILLLRRPVMLGQGPALMTSLKPQAPVKTPSPGRRQYHSFRHVVIDAETLRAPARRMHLTHPRSLESRAAASLCPLPRPPGTLPHALCSQH